MVALRRRSDRRRAQMNRACHFDHPDLPYWLVPSKGGLPGPEIRKIVMNLCNPHSILSQVAILILFSAIVANAAESFSYADKAFGSCRGTGGGSLVVSAKSFGFSYL